MWAEVLSLREEIMVARVEGGAGPCAALHIEVRRGAFKTLHRGQE